MPRRSKGPRLYLRRGRVDSRSGKRLPDIWFIRDGKTQRSTGFAESQLPEAEKALASYIKSKWVPPEELTDNSLPAGHPATILVAEVLAFYAKEKAPTTAQPENTAIRLETLSDWWDVKTLADVKRSNCQAYVQHRTSQFRKQPNSTRPSTKKVSDQTARRELEDLSAAIGYYAGEYPLLQRPTVWLPDKTESPREALTRSQAAGWLKAAMGYRRDPVTGRWTRRDQSTITMRHHMRRILLIGYYTGTRPGVIPELLWTESPSHPWVDLEGGMIWRRGKRQKEHKTKRRPVVKMPRALVAHMKRWKRMDDEEARRRAEAARAAGLPEPPPITNVIHYAGKPIRTRPKRTVRQCVADAGLPAEVSLHWLRHTCATWLMERNVSAWDTAAFTGMTVHTLEKHYGHHRPDHLSAAAGAYSRHRQ